MANFPDRSGLRRTWLVLPLVTSLILSCQSLPPRTSNPDLPPLDSVPLDSLPADPAPPPPPEGAFLGQISPAQASQLNSLGVEVVVPGVIPAGFKVAELRISQGEDSLGYMIVYYHEQGEGPGQCFAVEFARDGMEDPPATTEKLSITPPLFGSQTYGLHHGQFQDPALQRQFPLGTLYSDWLQGQSGGYRLIGAGVIGELFPTLKGCQDVDPGQALQLVENLTWLSADPIDGGL